MAANRVILKVQGFDEVQRAFRELEPKLAKKVIRQSVRKGMKTMQVAVQQNAPVDTGKGRRRIRVRTSKGPRGSIVRHTIAFAILVGDSIKKGVKDSTWYMWLQELGYHIGKRLRSGSRVVGYAPSGGRGSVVKKPGLHFTRRAMRSKESAVKNQIIVDIMAGIEREAGKP